MINLMSDTVTRPTAEMLKAMMSAEVGDDVFGEDPTINRLEKMASGMFGKEAALFCPSGTMTNQLAIKCHTNPMDEMICEKLSHVFQSENGGFAFHSGISVNTIDGINGQITAEQITQAIRPKYDWLAESKLVVLENSCNIAGGSYYDIEEIKKVRTLCTEKELGLHLDGARLFNVLVETGTSTREMGSLFDSISICLSKGLGAPVGSLLLGTKDFIKKARRFRKAFGGGMRQAGYLAAAGIYALENNIDRLKIDNDKAKEIGKILSEQSYVKALRPVQTNIVFFELKEEYKSADFLAYLEEHNLKAVAFSDQLVRFTTHLDFHDEMMPQVIEAIKSFV